MSEWRSDPLLIGLCKDWLCSLRINEDHWALPDYSHSWRKMSKRYSAYCNSLCAVVCVVVCAVWVQCLCERQCDKDSRCGISRLTFVLGLSQIIGWNFLLLVIIIIIIVTIVIAIAFASSWGRGDLLWRFGKGRIMFVMLLLWHYTSFLTKF